MTSEALIPAFFSFTGVSAFARLRAMYHSNLIPATVRKIIIIVTNANQLSEVTADKEMAAVNRPVEPAGIKRMPVVQMVSRGEALHLELA